MDINYKNEFAKLEAEQEATAFMSKLEYEESLQQKTIWTVDKMKEILNKYDDQVCKAIVKLYDYQTYDEQICQDTHEQNGVGFNGVDAPILSSFAEFYKKTGFLTPKQLVIARKKIMKYAGQLCKIANQEV